MTFSFANHTGRAPRLLLTLVAVFAMVGAFVSPVTAAQDDEPLRVVASFSILADWVGQVGGEHVDVTSIVPANGDAHTFDPDPATVASIADAEVIFVIGPSFDGWMEDVINSSYTDATVVVIMDSIDLTAATHDHDHEDEHAEDHDEEAATDDGHDHSGTDPHIWGDASLVRSAVGVIAETLAAADPDNADAYHANADAYSAELEELDIWIHEQVAMIPEENRKLVTSHDTFGYYADAYGFEIIGTALGSISTESGDPSAADIATLVEQIDSAGVPAIFAENVVNPDLMQAIADETGVELAPALYSDALGDTDSGASTYIDMMRSNTTTIVEALGGE